jgi:hypothetical protein
MGRDLPDAVVQRIAKLARSRCILGTNKYARVSRQWRDASSSEEPEQLQLFMDLRFMSDEEDAMASRWLDMHGQGVDVLVMAAGGIGAPPTSCYPTLSAAAGALGNLRRLEVHQQHSLSLLAPVLGQLLQLQHLAVEVSMACKPPDQGFMKWGEKVDGVLQDHYGHRWEQVPDLQQLCSRLTHLHLRLDWEEGDLETDPRLPRLLPATLQHLTLSTQQPQEWEVWLRPIALTHLAALQQLRLDGVVVSAEASLALAEHLQALQQLWVHTPEYCLRFDDQDLLLQLGAKLQGYTMEALEQGPANQLVQLTQLVLLSDGTGFHNTAQALGALTRLQELSLLDINNAFGTLEVVEQAAAMSQLRSLQLMGSMCDPVDLGVSLAQCTQLTRLELAVRGSVIAGGMQGVCYLPVPQQLVGLRRLTVPAELLEQEAGAWLAPLTALTRVGVNMTEAAPWQRLRAMEGEGHTHRAKAQALLQQVADWPASLQQVVFWVAKYSSVNESCPSCWQHTPAQPGAMPFGVWFEEGRSSGDAFVAQGWARPFRRCPHLPGVWELQGEVEGG